MTGNHLGASTARRAELPPGAQHGTTNAYCNHACRCDECRFVWATYCRENNHRVGRHTPIEVYRAEVAVAAASNHGTEASYKRCHCFMCRRAAAEARRRRRWADIEKQREYDRQRKAKLRTAGSAGLPKDVA